MGAAFRRYLALTASVTFQQHEEGIIVVADLLGSLSEACCSEGQCKCLDALMTRRGSALRDHRLLYVLLCFAFLVVASDLT